MPLHGHPLTEQAHAHFVGSDLMLDTSALLTPPLGDAVTAREHDADVAARLCGFNQIYGMAANRPDVVCD